MMKRMQFVASLFGVGGLASTKPEATIKGIAVSHSLHSGGRLELKKPQNNECPYCGTMAPEYHRPSLAKSPPLKRVLGTILHEDGSRNLVCEALDGTMFEEFVDRDLHIVSLTGKVPTGPTRVPVDGGCKNCGAAFWQNTVN